MNKDIFEKRLRIGTHAWAELFKLLDRPFTDEDAATFYAVARFARDPRGSLKVILQYEGGEVIRTIIPPEPHKPKKNTKRK